MSARRESEAYCRSALSLLSQRGSTLLISLFLLTLLAFLILRAHEATLESIRLSSGEAHASLASRDADNQVTRSGASLYSTAPEMNCVISSRTRGATEKSRTLCTLPSRYLADDIITLPLHVCPTPSRLSRQLSGGLRSGRDCNVPRDLPQSDAPFSIMGNVVLAETFSTPGTDLQRSALHISGAARFPHLILSREETLLVAGGDIEVGRIENPRAGPARIALVSATGKVVVHEMLGTVIVYARGSPVLLPPLTPVCDAESFGIWKKRRIPFALLSDLVPPE